MTQPRGAGRSVTGLLALLLFCPVLLRAQAPAAPDGQPLTLEQCISFALTNKPAVKQARLDEEIGERQINASLSGWLPQLSAQFNYNHFLKLQTTAFGDNLVRIGRKNTSNLLFQANQTLYSSSLLLASRASRFTRIGLDQNTTETRINTVVEVSKAFYNVLLTEEQIRILEENVARLQKQYQDAQARFDAGLVDKTDYQRASITLANTRADRKRLQELLKARHAQLKALMGLPPESPLTLAYDQTTITEQDVLTDTTQALNYTARVEYQQLQTRRELQRLNTRFYQTGYLPEVSGFINYNFLYLNNDFAELYKQSYPTSVAGLTAALPIFQGTRRLQNIKIARLQEERLDVELESARNQINTEYQTALANYKSDLNEWRTLRQNAQTAEEVYSIIKLQYDEGIKAYVDLVIAEADLRTAQLNYYNALFEVLASKLDLQRALGTIDLK